MSSCSNELELCDTVVDHDRVPATPRDPAQARAVDELLRRFIRDPRVVASEADVDSNVLLVRYEQAIERRLRAGGALQRTERPSLATLGASLRARSTPQDDANRIQMGMVVIVAVASAAIVATMLITILMRRKPV